jgi:shikimate kinase
MQAVPLLLVGFMGSGKSTLGPRLAQRLGWTFHDLDEKIEAAAGCSIRQIFETRGEAEFRRREREQLHTLLATAAPDPRQVIALGGGAFVQPDNFELLRQAPVCTLFLDVPFDELLRRCSQMDNRPLFRDREAFAALYQQRLPFYRQAHATIAAGPGDPDAIVERILELLAEPLALCPTPVTPLRSVAE